VFVGGKIVDIADMPVREGNEGCDFLYVWGQSVPLTLFVPYYERLGLQAATIWNMAVFFVELRQGFFAGVF
jgi:hypothetical protein